MAIKGNLLFILDFDGVITKSPIAHFLYDYINPDINYQQFLDKTESFGDLCEEVIIDKLSKMFNRNLRVKLVAEYCAERSIRENYLREDFLEFDSFCKDNDFQYVLFSGASIGRLITTLPKEASPEIIYCSQSKRYDFTFSELARDIFNSFHTKKIIYVEDTEEFLFKMRRFLPRVSTVLMDGKKGIKSFHELINIVKTQNGDIILHETIKEQ